MALDALLDSRVSIWRLDDGSGGTNRLGEPDKNPTKVQSNVRASLDNPRILLSRDSAAGDRPTGTMLMIIQKKANLLLNDMIFIEKGANAGSWWIVQGAFRAPSRGSHLEGYVSPFVGTPPI